MSAAATAASVLSQQGGNDEETVAFRGVTAFNFQSTVASAFSSFVHEAGFGDGSLGSVQICPALGSIAATTLGQCFDPEFNLESNEASHSVFNAGQDHPDFIMDGLILSVSDVRQLVLTLVGGGIVPPGKESDHHACNLLSASAFCLIGILALVRISANRILSQAGGVEPRGDAGPRFQQVTSSAEKSLFRSFLSIQGTGLAKLLLLADRGKVQVDLAGQRNDRPLPTPLALSLPQNLLEELLAAVLSSLIPFLMVLDLRQQGSSRTRLSPLRGPSPSPIIDVTTASPSTDNIPTSGMTRDPSRGRTLGVRLAPGLSCRSESKDSPFPGHVLERPGQLDDCMERAIATAECLSVAVAAMRCRKVGSFQHDIIAEEACCRHIEFAVELAQELFNEVITACYMDFSS